MVLNRLIAMVLVLVLTIVCIPNGWAAEAKPDPGGGAVAAAVVSDIIYVPGKVTTCVMGAGFWTVAMVITLGTAYTEAGKFIHGCCTGKWVITPEDMAAIE